MDNIATLIRDLGFPIVVCIGGGYALIQVVIHMFNKIIEDAKEDKNILKQELEFNRQVSTELLATNKLLAQDLTGKVDNLTEEIHDFIEASKK